MEKLYLAKVYKALMSQVKVYVTDVRSRGLSYANSRLTTNVVNVPMTGIVQEIYLKSGISNANQIYSRLRKYETRQLKYRTFGFNEKWTADIIRYFQMHLLEKVVIPISDETIDIIQHVVQKATEEGMGVEETVDAILEKTIEINRMRARRIVRTETVRATNFGGMLGAWESPYEVTKGWTSAHDSRVRGRKPKDKFSHEALDEMWTDLLEPFFEPISGEQILYPGDPNASAGNTINCRCGLKYKPKKDKQGRLIKKQVPMRGMQTSLVDVLAGAMLGTEIFDTLFD